MNAAKTAPKFPVKTVRGYAALARFMAEIGAPNGFVDRRPLPTTPFAYSETATVYHWNGMKVVILETSHRRYDVFCVDMMTVFSKQSAAEAFVRANPL